MKRRERRLQDLDQEIRDHIEMATQDNIDRGMSPEEARRAALRKFGNVTRVKEDSKRLGDRRIVGCFGLRGKEFFPRFHPKAESPVYLSKRR